MSPSLVRSSTPTKAMKKEKEEHAFATRALHVGSEPHLSASNGVIPALDMSTTYLQNGVGNHKGFEYTRSQNPTRLALERLLASLEGAHIDADSDSEENGPAALAMSTGSAATATVVSALTAQGGHIVSVSDVYGGTSRYMTKVANVQQGVDTTFVDLSYSVDSSVKRTREEEDQEIIDRLESAIRDNTKVIWSETPTNPLLALVPIRVIASVAKKHGIPLVIDNTFASPFYQNPLELGADVVIHSITKYINGHSDVAMGAIITPNPTLLSKFRFLQNAHGAVPSPFDAWLVIRGIKTLALRAKQHGLNGLHVARWLQTEGRKRGWVRSVRYPGLNRGAEETNGQRRERELAWDQMSAQARAWAQEQGYSRDGEQGFPSGGMVAFYINSPAEASQDDARAAESFLATLRVFALAESLGGVESLAELPLKMTHAGVPVDRRQQLGIDGELVRLSVGIEEKVDLIDDLRNAFETALSSPH